jgi:hypothetical protein
MKDLKKDVYYNLQMDTALQKILGNNYDEALSLCVRGHKMS